MRTHSIVCMGAALIMIVSKYSFRDIPDYDASRVAAQIVSGVGIFRGWGYIYPEQCGQRIDHSGRNMGHSRSGNGHRGRFLFHWHQFGGVGLL